MTTARIRSALSPMLKALGFTPRGSQFVLHLPELEHAVSVFAVRRLTGYFEVVHSVYEAYAESAGTASCSPLIQERIQGFMEPYPGLWALDRLDTNLVAKQVVAIVSTFTSLIDVAHYYSDRYMASRDSALKAVAAPGLAKSVSRAEADKLLQYHSTALFASAFNPAPRLGTEIWAHCQEVGGYRYCAYLAANDTATFASLIYFPFASPDIEKGRKNDAVARALVAVRKRLLTDGGQPVLIPLTDQTFDHARATHALASVIVDNPPNLLPRREA